MELKDGVMHSDIQTRVSGDWEMEEGMRSSNSDQRCLCGHVKYLHAVIAWAIICAANAISTKKKPRLENHGP